MGEDYLPAKKNSEQEIPANGPTGNQFHGVPGKSFPNGYLIQLQSDVIFRIVYLVP